MRRLLATAILLASTLPAQAGDFRLYPGFVDRDAVVEMTTDKGLIVEIVLRCERQGNKVRFGIVTYSKVERLFCDSRLHCSRDAGRVMDATCGA